MTITFIVPVRHPDNMRNKEKEKRNTAETVRSISAQIHDDWHIVVVANEGTDLPAFAPSSRLSVLAVDFPPNRLHDPGQADKETWRQSVRVDKGRRILAGMLSRPSSGYYMIVDNDDFVSRRIAGFVAQNDGANGFYVRKGYIWEDGSRFLRRHDKMHTICGTSLIVRADLYALPPRIGDATDEYVAQMLGSHHYIAPYLESRGTPLSPLPFRGNVYRTLHENAHSLDVGFFSKPHDLFSKETLLKIANSRPLCAGVRREFWGGGL